MLKTNPVIMTANEATDTHGQHNAQTNNYPTQQSDAQEHALSNHQTKCMQNQLDNRNKHLENMQNPKNCQTGVALDTTYAT